MMRLMNLRTEARRLAVSPAHVRYIEREEACGFEDHVKVYIVDEAVPLRVSGTFDQVVGEWENALQGRECVMPDVVNRVEDEDIVDEQDEATPAYGSPRYSE